MASIPPTYAPIPIEPPPVAENGWTTSEAHVLAGMVVVVIVWLIAKLSLHLSGDQQATLTEALTGLIFSGGSYILSRGIRKVGTSA